MGGNGLRKAVYKAWFGRRRGLLIGDSGASTTRTRPPDLGLKANGHHRDAAEANQRKRVPGWPPSLGLAACIGQKPKPVWDPGTCIGQKTKLRSLLCHVGVKKDIVAKPGALVC